MHIDTYLCRNHLMAVAAVRYCLGRQTYIVGVCADWLIETWPHLHDSAREIILRDIEDEFLRDDEARARGDRHLPLGADMDRRQWERVRGLWARAVGADGAGGRGGARLMNDELRALADALEPMARAPRFEDIDVPAICAWMRACADAQPAAWRVECRWTDRSKGGDWRKYADYGTEAAARSSQQVFANPGDIEVRIVPLYAWPEARG